VLAEEASGPGHWQPGDLEGRLPRDDQLRARLHQVLAIVEHDQQVPCMKVLGKRVGQRLSESLVDVHRPTDGRCDQAGFAHPLQVHPTGPVGEPRRHLREVIESIAELLADPSFGDRMSKQLSGEDPETQGLLAIVRLALMEWDLDPASAPDLLAQFIEETSKTNKLEYFCEEPLLVCLRLC
jgi:hypothetical protein